MKLWIKKDSNTEIKRISELQKEVSFLSNLVYFLQKYIKEKENSPWAVSLRDVSRFCHFLVYFNENSVSEEQGVYIFKNSSKSASNLFKR